ncbi:MAG: hypothetical protein AAF649_13585, partial [Verrucomicrobiota bacterium]
RTRHEWTFVKYDTYDRAVLSGQYYNAVQTSSAAIQALVDTYYADAAHRHDVSLGGSGPMGYTQTAFPEGASETELLTASYYDTYDFLGGSSLNGSDYTRPEALNDASGSLELSEAFDRIKGQRTGSVTRLLGTEDFLSTLYYYDDEGRVIQAISENHLGGQDLISSQYDFSGNLRKIHSLETTPSDTLEMLMEYAYDHAGRLIEGYHTLNGGARTHVFSHDYNEVGQLIQKHLHGEGGLFQQTLDYTYHLKGWMEGINQSGGAENEGSPDPKDLFMMELIYDTFLPNLND